jgi:hypothetical protein
MPMAAARTALALLFLLLRYQLIGWSATNIAKFA